MKPAPGTVHHVTATERGQTVAAFLRAKLAADDPRAASWSQVQKLVRSRRVMIHGNICTDTARRLKDGEVVKVLAAAAAAPGASETAYRRGQPDNGSTAAPSNGSASHHAHPIEPTAVSCHECARTEYGANSSTTRP